MGPQRGDSWSYSLATRRTSVSYPPKEGEESPNSGRGTYSLLKPINDALDKPGGDPGADP